MPISNYHNFRRQSSNTSKRSVLQGTYSRATTSWWLHDLRAEFLLHKTTLPNPKDINELRLFERYVNFDLFARYNGTQSGEISRLNTNRQSIEDKLVPLLAHYV